MPPLLRSFQDWLLAANGQFVFNSSCRRAGISNFRIHDLRHTCAAWMVKAGVPLVRVRDLLGHSSITTTEIYSHLAPKDVIDAVNVLDRCNDLVTLNNTNA